MMMFNRHPRLRFFALSLSLASLSACNMLQPQSADNGLPDPDYQLDSEQRAHLEDKIVEEVSKVPEFEYEDIWARIRNGYGLPGISNAQADAHLKWYSNHQAHPDRATERSQRELHYGGPELVNTDMTLHHSPRPQL